MSTLTAITDLNFVAVVSNSDIPVLIDFWSPDCQPCLQLAPVLESLAAEYDGRTNFVKMNVYENQAQAALHNISLLPTLILYVGGHPALVMHGLQTKEKIQEALAPYLTGG